MAPTSGAACSIFDVEGILSARPARSKDPGEIADRGA
jgi:hypothetical protein